MASTNKGQGDPDELASFVVSNVEGLQEAISSKGDEGHGSYGAVYKVRVNGVPSVAKKPHKALVEQVSVLERNNVQDKFRRECIILSKLTHPNVVHFVGVHYEKDDPEDLTLLMECLDRDLDDFLNKQPNVPLSIKISILLDVSYGLLYLHSQHPPIVHRDLTARNILLTANGLTAKIADVGVAKLLDDLALAKSSHTQTPGQMKYMPPEALTKNADCSPKIDIFSFGHLSLYTVTQEFPDVNELMGQDAVRNIEQHTLQIEKRRGSLDIVGTEHCLYPIITECLQDYAEERPTATQIHAKLKRLSTVHPKRIVEVARICNCNLPTTEEVSDLRIQLTAVKNAKEVAVEQERTLQLKLQTARIEVEQLQVSCDKHLSEKERACREQEATIENLKERVAVFQEQAKTYQADFEEERKDRVKAHSKLADLELTEQDKCKEWRLKAESYASQLQEARGTIEARDNELQQSQKIIKDLRKKLKKFSNVSERDAKSSKRFRWSFKRSTSPPPNEENEATREEYPNDSLLEVESAARESLPTTPCHETSEGVETPRRDTSNTGLPNQQSLPIGIPANEGASAHPPKENCKFLPSSQPSTQHIPERDYLEQGFQPPQSDPTIQQRVTVGTPAEIELDHHVTEAALTKVPRSDAENRDHSVTDQRHYSSDVTAERAVIPARLNIKELQSRFEGVGTMYATRERSASRSNSILSTDTLRKERAYTLPSARVTRSEQLLKEDREVQPSDSGTANSTHTAATMITEADSSEHNKAKVRGDQQPLTAVPTAIHNPVPAPRKRGTCAQLSSTLPRTGLKTTHEVNVPPSIAPKPRKRKSNAQVAEPCNHALNQHQDDSRSVSTNTSQHNPE